MFEMTSSPIEDIMKEKDFSNAEVGGVVTFEGKVRNHNNGFAVKSLEYQAYESMAAKEGQKIIEKAKELFDIEDVYCVHRTGHLQIGDMVVWVVALAKHRKAAFLACEYVINTVKLTVPIWKCEHYVSQAPKWVACHQCAEQKENVLAGQVGAL